jgi:hypothetical protein
MKAIGPARPTRELAGSRLTTMESGSLTAIGRENTGGSTTTTAGIMTATEISANMTTAGVMPMGGKGANTIATITTAN